jgi:hypothetical protein
MKYTFLTGADVPLQLDIWLNVNPPSLTTATLPLIVFVSLALFRGPLVVRNDCVLAGQPGDYTLPIWQDGFTVERDDDGRAIVWDGDGATVAIEGEVFEMGGGYIAEFEPEDKVDPRDVQIEQVAGMTGNTIPKRCLGSDVNGVWWVGDTEAISGS